MPPRTIFHLDMDAFFASIEQRDTPAFHGRPLIVGAKPGTRGVVCAASYEARKFGVRSAMPISEAVRRCPQGCFVVPRHDAYVRESEAVMAVLEDFTPSIEQVSIDEAFLDMSGTQKLFGKPVDIAKKMAGRIETELRLTASIGIAPNKFLAKIASDLDKPRGITLAPFDPVAIVNWLAPMPVGRIWGIGKKTDAVLQGLGIATVGDLQALSLEQLSGRFGKQGEDLFALSRGIDDRPVDRGDEVKSVSREYTFNVDSGDREAWKRVLFSLAQDVSRRARRKGIKGNTVVLTYRRPDFSRHSKRAPLAKRPTNVAKFIYEDVLALLERISEKSLRLIGVGITGLDEEVQTSLFSGEHTTVALETAEAAMDSIVARFGKEIIAKGRELEKTNRNQ
jgi:DNA polymerase IV